MRKSTWTKRRNYTVAVINDITFSNDFAGVCGITEDELVKSFSLEIDKMAKDTNLSASVCLDKLRKTYMPRIHGQAPEAECLWIGRLSEWRACMSSGSQV